MKSTFGLLFLILTASEAGGQVRRVPRIAEPATWVSLSAGLLRANAVSDGKTGSTWDFGAASTLQLRGSLERAIQNQSSIGITATYAHAPFTYHGSSEGPNSCTRCSAHMDIVTLAASFHVGGGPALHQVLEASAGIAQYRNLRRDSDNASLEPVGGNIDPYVAFGYGFGYAFNPSLHVSVVQDIGVAIHERTGLTSDQSNTLRLAPLRLNLRYGFGTRARLR